MTEVRKHQRVTASGKRTTVRHHTRGGERTRREEEAEAAREAWADRNAPHVSSLPPAAAESQPEEWWAEDGLPPPGEFWDEGDAGEDGEHLHPDWAKLPQDEPEHSPAFAAMLEQDPSLADEQYEKLRYLRESGYDGPVDQDGNPTDPKAARKAARHRLKVAEDALAENAEREKAQGIDWETPRYHKLNDEYWEARKAADLPWWRNW